jgi:hypothetical protein
MINFWSSLYGYRINEALKGEARRWRDRPIFYQAGEDITYSISR